ncbi:MAG: tetratricopeptide repeat protein [Tepidisphaeraceae bacterium]|jgi:predicted O-linked N-acetylglucosamine transferase (SPINDLY family)
MPDAIFDTAVAHHRAGRLDEAAGLYRKVLDLQPNQPDALHLLGLALAQMGRAPEGAKLIERAIILRPNVAVFHANLGYALRLMGRPGDAAAAWRRAVTLDPAAPSAWFNLSQILAEIGNPSAAIDACNHALALNPGYVEAHNHLGSVLREQKRIDESLACFRRALAANPRYAEAHHNLALALADSGRIDLAVESEAIASELAPDVTACASGRIYMLHFHPQFDRAALHREMRQYNQRFAQPLAPEIRPHANHRDPDRRLRIGYVSPDFYFQAECFFLLPLLQSHDRRNFEIHCYCSVLHPDYVTRRFKEHADVWHEVAAQADDRLAERIRGDQIDVLIDLTMHMRNNRLLVFARKPAPVQATWLAYPGGTGVPAIDYRLTDALLDPPDSDPHYAERSIRLPGCWCCYHPLSNAAIEPHPRDFVRFASLNNPAKLNDSTLSLWSGVLRTVPGSRLLLLAISEDHRGRIRRLFADAGIGEDRLEFTGFLPRPRYLKLYNTIDACLDPLPYNGITTTLDALWMGVPVVSLIGQTAPGRAGLSILTTAGMPELVARSPEEFIQIAASAPHMDRHAIRQKLSASPVMDAPRFARSVEGAYRQMWRTWCERG